MQKYVKPNHTVSIVVVKANEDIPDTFLHVLCKENPSAAGFAIQVNGKIEVEKFPDLRGRTIDDNYATMRKIITNSKKHQRMFCFHAFPPEFDETECQPWIIVKDSKGSPIIVVALEGDLPGLETDDGDSEMLGALIKEVGPKIEALYNLTGNDPKKLYAALKDQTLFGNDMLKLIGHRAIFAFMPTEGDVFSHGKNEIGGNFSWGSASMAYDYTESAIEAATIEPAAPEPEPVKKSKWEDDEPAKPITTDPKTGVHTVGGTTFVKVEEPKPVVEVPKVTAPVVTDPIQRAADGTGEGHWEHPPLNMHGKPLKKWYRDMDAKLKGEKKGDLRPDWSQKPAVWIAHKTELKALADLSQTALAAVQQVEQPQLPVIDGALQAKGVEFLKKYLDGSSNVIPNPLELQKQEAKLALFSELCRPLDDMERLTTTRLLELIETMPKLAWLYLIEMRRDRMNRKQLARQGELKLGELTGTEKPEIAEPAAKPLVPSVPEHQAPKKEFKYG